MLGPTLETERLRLRPPCADDFDAWIGLMADPDASRFIGGPQSRPVAWRSLCVVTGAWVVRGYSMFSYIEKATGRWIGRGGPWQPEGWPGTEVGWALVPSARGKGYATEAATACIDWAFDTLGWDEVIHPIDPANQPSIRVAQRLGSRRLRSAQLPPPFDSTVEIYGQDRATWRRRNNGE